MSTSSNAENRHLDSIFGLDLLNYWASWNILSPFCPGCAIFIPLLTLCSSTCHLQSDEPLDMSPDTTSLMLRCYHANQWLMSMKQRSSASFDKFRSQCINLPKKEIMSFSSWCRLCLCWLSTLFTFPHLILVSKSSICMWNNIKSKLHVHYQSKILEHHNSSSFIFFILIKNGINVTSELPEVNKQGRVTKNWKIMDISVSNKKSKQPTSTTHLWELLQNIKVFWNFWLEVYLYYWKWIKLSYLLLIL